MHFNPFSFNIYYAVLMAFAGALGVLLLTTEKSEPGESTISPVIPEVQHSIIEQPVEKTDKSTYTAEKAPVTSSPTIILPDTPIKDQDTKTEALSVLNITKTDPQVTEQDIAKDIVSEPYSPSSNPHAWFDMSVQAGCAPLQVQFKNFSGNALQYSWSFGDGGISDEKDPVYIFDEPGLYFITMTATGSNNTLCTYTDSVRVFSLPEVRFEMDVPEKAAAGEPVYFYNFTRDAADYSWNFGDGNTSGLKDPSHSYMGEGLYNVTLVAVTTEGCRDSMTIKDVLKADQPEIKFPTAFSPNMSGSVGGNYTGLESNNDVFHPYRSENPVEYLLRIFNRNGHLIFETNDINIGWDGYYREELQPPGVYVWKVRARFADGRTVVKAGDVTLLWRKM